MIKENEFGFRLIKEVPDSYGHPRLPLNDIYRCLYVHGQIPPDFVPYRTNLLTQWRWPHYLPNYANYAQRYAPKTLFEHLEFFNIRDEKEALTLAYLTDFGCKDNQLFQHMQETKNNMEANLKTGECDKKVAVDWFFGWADRHLKDHLSMPLAQRRNVVADKFKTQKALLNDRYKHEFNPQGMYRIYDVRDAGGHPRLHPYEIIDLFDKGIIPPGYVPNPDPETAQFKYLNYIPERCMAPNHNLPRMLKMLQDVFAHRDEKALINLVYTGDYGRYASPIWAVLTRLTTVQAYDEETDTLRIRDPYIWILENLRGEMHLWASMAK